MPQGRVRGYLLVAVATAALVVGVLAVVQVVRDVARPAAGELVVSTTLGETRGVLDDDVRTWRGLPFAAPPVAGLRWREPQPARAWRGVREASSNGDACVQPADYAYGDADLSVRRGSSEDCLYLNVTAPRAEPDAPLPVVVWLHGGGLFEGSGSLVDPTRLAARGSVVVTVNYRLGLLGFFAHPALRQDVANLGLLDQMAALRWVRANIAGFGGDPGSVTLLGGSAGAMSVNALMSAPAAHGLFDRAIAQSAPGDSAAITIETARERNERDFPVRTAAELRALPASAFLSSTFNVLNGDAPILDALLPEPSAVAFAVGNEASVPYLVGSNDAEFTDDDYRAAGVQPARVRATLGGKRHFGLVEAYGREAYTAHVLNDLVFTVPGVALALDHDRRAPTYRYRFAVDPEGSHHGTEVGYVFGLVDGEREKLADQIAGYWLAFARTGTPEGSGSPSWPRASGTSVMLFTPDGPEPLAEDPWSERLQALYVRTAALRLPG